MHPIEHLRYVARSYGASPIELVEEAAYALGALADEPRILLPACRRLLAFHPTCAPLWSLCARMLCAVDPRAEGRAVVEDVTQDETADELAASLPGAATLCCEATDAVASAVNERPDLTVRVVGTPFEVSLGLRRSAASFRVNGYTLDELEEAFDGADLAVVEVLAVAPGGALLSRTGAALADGAWDIGIDTWGVAARGTVLPQVLFDALVQRCAKGSPEAIDFDDEEPSEPRVVPLVRMRCLVTELGPASPKLVAARASCPPAPELAVEGWTLR